MGKKKSYKKKKKKKSQYNQHPHVNGLLESCLSDVYRPRLSCIMTSCIRKAPRNKKRDAQVPPANGVSKSARPAQNKSDAASYKLANPTRLALNSFSPLFRPKQDRHRLQRSALRYSRSQGLSNRRGPDRPAHASSYPFPIQPERAQVRGWLRWCRFSATPDMKAAALKAVLASGLISQHGFAHEPVTELQCYHGYYLTICYCLYGVCTSMSAH